MDKANLISPWRATAVNLTYPHHASPSVELTRSDCAAGSEREEENVCVYACA